MRITLDHRAWKVSAVRIRGQERALLTRDGRHHRIVRVLPAADGLGLLDSIIRRIEHTLRNW